MGQAVLIGYHWRMQGQADTDWIFIECMHGSADHISWV